MMTSFSVSLSPVVFEPLGGVMLRAKPDSELAAIKRRVSRTATLDGGATIEDMGFTASDSEITINVIFETMSQEDKVLRLIRLYPLMTLATRYGCYVGVADFFKPSSGGGTIRFLVREQVS